MAKIRKPSPTKEDLIDKLMEVVEGYDGETVRPTDLIRAVEVLNKMLGFNSPEESKIEVAQLRFELD